MIVKIEFTEKAITTTDDAGVVAVFTSGPVAERTIIEEDVKFSDGSEEVLVPKA